LAVPSAPVRSDPNRGDQRIVIRGVGRQIYHLEAEKPRVARDAFARKSKDPADYPSPDLAIEINLSPPGVDRQAIYAAHRVVEVWRFDGAMVVIEHLQADGTYAPAESSRFLPVSAADIRRELVDEDSSRSVPWERRLID
jgi:hypothetical protein